MKKSCSSSQLSTLTSSTKFSLAQRRLMRSRSAASNFSYFPHSPTMIICLTPIPGRYRSRVLHGRGLTNFSPISVGRGSRHSEDRTKVSSGSSASGWSQCFGLRTARSLVLFLVTCSKVHDLRSGCLIRTCSSPQSSDGCSIRLSITFEDLASKLPAGAGTRLEAMLERADAAGDVP